MLYTTGKLLMLIKASINKTVEELHLTDAYVFKGTVASVEELPTTGNKNGDVYNIGADLNGDNYVWTGSSWDNISGGINLISDAYIDALD